MTDKEYNEKIVKFDKLKKMIVTLEFPICIVILMIIFVFPIMSMIGESKVIKTGEVFTVFTLILLAVNCFLFLILGIIWLILKKKLIKLNKEIEEYKKTIID